MSQESELRQRLPCREKRRINKGFAPPSVIELPKLPPMEQAAFAAREYDSPDARWELYETMLSFIRYISHVEGWQYHESQKAPRLETLAKLLVAEFLKPADYRKHGSMDNGHAVGVLAVAMGMDYHLFKHQWLSRFEYFRPIIMVWYSSAREKLES